MKYHIPFGAEAIYLGKLDGSKIDHEWPSINITAKSVDSKDYYTTFYSSPAKYKLPAGVDAYIGKVEGETLQLTRIATGGQVLPAGTAVVLKGTAKDITMAFCDGGDPVKVDPEDNDLEGCDLKTPTPDDGTVFVLGAAGGEVGFYEYKAANLGANKAYLKLPVGARPLTFAFDDGTESTGIESNAVRTAESNAQREVFSLSGQRQGSIRKGLNIVRTQGKNTKKVFVK